MYEYARTAADRGLRVIVAGAGGAAHLPGMTASMTALPVIGVPVPLEHLDGLDSLLSIVQMPAGIPVATVAVGNARNAGLLAVRILGASDDDAPCPHGAVPARPRGDDRREGRAGPQGVRRRSRVTEDAVRPRTTSSTAIPNIVVDGARHADSVLVALPLAEERVAARRCATTSRPRSRSTTSTSPSCTCGRGRVEQPLRPGRAHEHVRARGPRRRAGATRAASSTWPASATSAPTRDRDSARIAWTIAALGDGARTTATRTPSSSTACPSCSTIPSASATTGPTRTSTSPRSEAGDRRPAPITIEERRRPRPRGRDRPRGLDAAAGAPLHAGRAPGRPPDRGAQRDRSLPRAVPPGHHYELAYRYETWVQYTSRRHPGRVDLTALADELSDARAR